MKRQNQDEQPDQNMDQPSDDVRGTKRKAEEMRRQEVNTASRGLANAAISDGHWEQD